MNKLVIAAACAVVVTGAQADGGRYTMEHMAEHFAQGITAALQLPAR